MTDGATSPSRFAGKVALITGGASGIGLATARRIVAEGGRVVVGDVNDEALAAAGSELGDAGAALRCDVTVEADVEALAAAAVERFGSLDVACANAGIGAVARLVDAEVAEWSRVLDVNLTGPFLTIKHAARRMGRGGSIVVTASLNAVQPGIGMGAYCSSKAGVAMLARVAALELGPAGIRVNAVGPGLVRTALTDGAFLLPAIVEEFEENAPLGRHAAPEEVAALIAFLASDEAGFVSGSLHLIDGGASTKRYPDMLGRLAEAFPEAAG